MVMRYGSCGFLVIFRTSLVRKSLCCGCVYRLEVVIDWVNSSVCVCVCVNGGVRAGPPTSVGGRPSLTY